MVGPPLQNPNSRGSSGSKAVARQKLSNREIAKRQREGRYHDGRRPLTAKIVERLKGEGRYKDGLMPGLYLQVSETGTKSWLLRYELNGQPERWMGLGSATIFSLAEARIRARAARQQLADNIDPLQAKREAKAAAKQAAAKKLTFGAAATEYAKQNEAKWTNAAWRASFMSSLQADAFPLIGDLDVAAIDTPDVLRVLDPIWTTKTVTASRIRRRIEWVLDWATVRGHRPKGDNPARWRGHLDQVLPKRRQIAPVAHLKALPYAELPAFMAELRARESNAARMLEFTILTAARTNEVLGATWSEIDLNNKLWTVPAARMKADKEHRVPLSGRRSHCCGHYHARRARTLFSSARRKAAASPIWRWRACWSACAATRRCTASARRSAIGRTSAPPTPTTPSSSAWRTVQATRSRRPTGAATCSTSAGG